MTIIGLLADLLRIVLDKLIGLRLEQRADARYLLLSELLSLLKAISSLETAAVGMAMYLRTFSSGGNWRMWRAHVEPHVRDLMNATSALESSCNHLGSALELYAPPLAKLLSDVRVGKQRLVSAFGIIASQPWLRLDSAHGSDLSLVRLTLLELDPTTRDDDAYGEILTAFTSVADSRSGDKRDLAQRQQHLVEVFRSSTSLHTLQADEHDSLAALGQALDIHLARITSAKESLRDYIVSNFTMAEYVKTIGA
jgi:hypothetical protein